MARPHTAPQALPRMPELTSRAHQDQIQAKGQSPRAAQVLPSLAHRLLDSRARSAHATNYRRFSVAGHQTKRQMLPQGPQVQTTSSRRGRPKRPFCYSLHRLLLDSIRRRR